MSRAAEPRHAYGTPLALVLGGLAAFQVYAFHWGVITPDTVFQWEQALSGHYDDWHPPATTWLWRQLMHFGPGTAPVLLFDVALYWSGIGLVADVLRRAGRHRAMVAVLCCAALPIPFGQLGAILKDPLLAACCLAASGLLLAYGEEDRRRRAFARFAALALLLFASATRINAVFATAPLLAAWWPRRWLVTPLRTGIAVAGSAGLLVVGAWAIDDLALAPHHSQPIFSLVNFDLAGISIHDGPRAYPDLERATERRLIAACYDPRQFNPTFREDCNGAEDGLREYARRHRLSAEAIWITAVAHSPTAYLRHRLDHLNHNLRFLVADVPNDAVYVMTTPNRFGLGFTQNGATRAIVRGARLMALSPFGRPATWLAVALGLLLVAPGLRSRRFIMATAGSAIVYGSAYAVVSVASDLRYNLWTMLGAMIALVVALSDTGSLADVPTSRRRICAAALPAFLTVIGELTALCIGGAV